MGLGFERGLVSEDHEGVRCGEGCMLHCVVRLKEGHRNFFGILALESSVFVHFES